MNPLTVFPRHPSAPDTYYINGAWAPAAITAVEKRFSEAELLAEYWAAHGEANATMTGNPRLTFSRRQALRRAATQPAHDDGPA